MHVPYFSRILSSLCVSCRYSTSRWRWMRQKSQLRRQQNSVNLLSKMFFLVGKLYVLSEHNQECCSEITVAIVIPETAKYIINTLALLKNMYGTSKLFLFLKFFYFIQRCFICRPQISLCRRMLVLNPCRTVRDFDTEMQLLTGAE